MAAPSSPRGQGMPAMLYGTAWKGDRTAALVVEAVKKGFRGIDTACQPKHYQEHLVGEALATIAKEAGVRRESVFLQTKYTSVDGQDRSKPLPYDATAPVEAQVEQSVAKSLSNLGTTYLDAVLLHSPLRTPQLTLRAWGALEAEVGRGRVLRIGVSNIYDPEELRALYAAAKVKPSIVQNRFYPETGWDKGVRAFCKQNGIAYQSFWTLTGNPRILASGDVADIAARAGLSREGVMYKFVQMLGVVPLNGTTSPAHMEADLAVIKAPPLSDQDFATLAAMINEA